MVQLVNVTVDDVSPLITYFPPEAWHPGDASDPSLSSYYNGTYTQTTQYGASATLSFNGTGVWIFGAKRGNHAPFNISLDGSSYFDNGFSQTNLFEQVLFPGPNLTLQNHTVSIADSLTEPTKPYLDIDKIVYQVAIPEGYKRYKVEDDNRDYFAYTGTWETDPQGLSGYSGGTGHTTTGAESALFFTFEGVHVELYGAVGPTFGNYTVQVDGGPVVTYNATNTNLALQVLLFQSNSLAPGNHHIELQPPPLSAASPNISVDFAIIYTLSAPSTSTPLSAGAIGGIAVGVCGVILLTLAGIFFVWRRRRRRLGPIPTEPPQPMVATGPVIHHTPSLPTTLERNQPSTLSASTDISLLHPSLSPNSTPSPPHSNSSASNTDSRSRLILHNPSPSLGSGRDGTQASLQEVLASAENIAPYQNTGHTRRPLPQPGRSNSIGPSTALVLAPPIPGDLRNVRMQVEGRSQDFGPISFVPDPEHDGNLLPPDYHQATQPFPSQGR